MKRIDNEPRHVRGGREFIYCIVNQCLSWIEGKEATLDICKQLLAVEKVEWWLEPHFQSTQTTPQLNKSPKQNNSQSIFVPRSEISRIARLTGKSNLEHIKQGRSSHHSNIIFCCISQIHRGIRELFSGGFQAAHEARFQYRNWAGCLPRFQNSRGTCSSQVFSRMGMCGRCGRVSWLKSCLHKGMIACDGLIFGRGRGAGPTRFLFWRWGGRMKEGFHARLEQDWLVFWESWSPREGLDIWFILCYSSLSLCIHSKYR